MRFIYLSVVAVLMAAPATSNAQGDPPSGWMGLLITTGVGQRTASGAMVFNDYPVIESIDPGSPAERAGLQAGDILLSINSQDFRKNPIPMNALLVPGQRVVFRYRRNDATMTSSLLVAERPPNTSSRVQLSIIGPDPMMGQRPPDGFGPPMNMRVALPPLVSVGAVGLSGSVSSIRIVGAELTPLNDGLRDALKIKGNGLFVVNVVSGTPAGEAGFKSGDVIVSANREAIQNPGQIIRLMTESTNGALDFRIVRKQKLQSITLRW